MIAIVIRSRGVRAMALHAASRIQPLAEACTLPDLCALLERAPASPCLVVHDFEPDPGDSLARLRKESEAGRGFGVLALLSAPFAPALDSLLGASREFPLVGVCIAVEETVADLSDRMEEALHRIDRRGLFDVLMAEWRMDPLLARVARCELWAARPHTTLEGLLREAGVGRKRFVGVVRKRGIKPLRFLQGLRVMEAAELLQQGCTTPRTAERLGYGSLDTLRGHFRALAGMTPRAVRGRSLGEVARRIVDRS